MKPVFAALFSALLSLPTLAADLMVHDAWVRAMPPTARALPLYFTLHNGSDKEAILTGITTRDGAVELHQTVHEGDMMKMVRLEQLTLPAGEMATLKPMGMHAMIMGMSQVPAEGETLTFVASFQDGSTLNIQAQVRKGDSGAMANANEHEHHH